VPVTARESALLAALIRALAADAAARVDSGDPGPALPAELLRVAYWRAARDGLNGHGVDVHTGDLYVDPTPPIQNKRLRRRQDADASNAAEPVTFREPAGHE